TFDIHGGGADLTFPHHENEIAQSEGATGKPFVRYWLHNGFVRINDEKMSKSLGNFFTVREILHHYQAEEIRYFILTSHYRSPLNYDEDHLQNARAALTRFYTALRGLTVKPSAGTGEWMERFNLAMDDDFNTPEALAVLFDLTREINRARQSDEDQAALLAAELLRMGAVLGILQEEPESYLRGGTVSQEGLSDQTIETLVQQRLEARNARDWAQADRLRDQLKEAGVLLEDTSKGTSWRRG
ncbi:MAG: class I tRNA ligase family protein, partial [Gammaproteobacteria bacterium]|nr:class I tRNA ligase family protein [Gammaproteobacteria bacterium]